MAKSLINNIFSIIMTDPTKLIKSKSLDKWRCPKCSFDNLQLMSHCEICEEPQQKQLRIPQSSSSSKAQNQPGIRCPNESCKIVSPLTRDTCTKCGVLLFPMSDNDDPKHDDKEKPKVDLIVCRHCSFENDPINAYCLNCDRKMPAKRIPKKSAKPPRAARMTGMTYICPECGNFVRFDYTTGETDPCMVCQQKHPTKIVKSLCLFCDSKIKPDQQNSHDQKCQTRLKFFKKQVNPTFQRCTPLQYQTMVYMHNKCQKLHYRRQKALITRIEKLGYNRKDLQNLHHYIIHYAPIIIHMHVNTHFHFFLGDTHYRNQFQTAKSSGALSHSARTGWEDRMFDKKHHNATGFQRVKYGTMNFVNDPKGVRACMGYGQSYFLLKPHVRDRCTITDMDSSSPSSTLGTFRFIYHLLLKLSDAELTSAFQGSKGKQMGSHVIGSYKEIQIHGPVEFAKDIERVYISKDQLKLGDAKVLLEQVKTFCSKHGIDYEMFENNNSAPVIAFGGVAVPPGPAAPERVIGDAKQLTQQDLKPKPPPAPLGGLGLGFGGSGLYGGGFAFGMPLGGSIFGAHAYPAPAPIPFVPKKPQKKKEYGVDYI